MRRDYKAAVKAAVNGLYDGDSSTMEEALWAILEHLDPGMAELMSDNEEAARMKANDEEVLDEEEEDIEPITIEEM